MDDKRARRLLLVAFALSLLVHLVFAAYMRWRPGAVFDAPRERMAIVHTVTVERATPPARTPPPGTPPPMRVHAPVTHAVAVGPAAARIAERPAAPVPQTAAPSPSPTQSCLTHDTSVEMRATPQPADIPADARGSATNGTARVRVDVSAQGDIADVAVAASSGNAALDLVAEAMARSAQYTPATHQCKAMASSYLFSAKFIAW